MKRYDSLRKKIEKMTKAVKGSIAPYIAYIDRVNNDYTLVICFWDGKAGSGDKMPNPIIQQFSTSEKAEKALIDYLEINKPYNPFVLFSNEEEIYS